MNWKALIASVVLLAPVLTAHAIGPMTFREIAMLVRNGEEPQFILQDTARRKLLQRLTAAEEAELLSSGATPTLVNALRSPTVIATPEAVAAYNAQMQLQQMRQINSQNEERQARQAATPVPAAAVLDEVQKGEKPFDLKFTAIDGSEVNTAAMRGKVVLVDFWATWCGPCMMEAPNVVAAYQKYHDKGFEIIGISLDKDKAAVLKVTQANGMVWPQFFDGLGWKNAISTYFGIKSIPAMWLVNKQGILVSKDARPHLEADIEKLLAE